LVKLLPARVKEFLLLDPRLEVEDSSAERSWSLEPALRLGLACCEGNGLENGEADSLRLGDDFDSMRSNSSPILFELALEVKLKSEPCDATELLRWLLRLGTAK